MRCYDANSIYGCSLHVLTEKGEIVYTITVETEAATAADVEL